MISVIIPTYKPGIYIKECIDSLFNQSASFERYEILLILNGDKYPYFTKLKEVIDKYPEKFNISLLYTEKVGVSNARNIGIEQSQGESICFIDDDDIVSNSFIERLGERFSEEEIRVCNVLAFNDVIDNNKYDYLGRAFIRLRDRKYSLYEFRSFFSSSCCKVIPRELIGEKRFPLKHSVGEDALFMASLSYRVKDISFTSEDAVYYRRLRSNSASRRNKGIIRKIRERLFLIKDYISLYITYYPNYNLKFILSRIVASILVIFK